MIIIGAMGRNGSGKDALIDYLCQRCDMHKLSVGDIVRQIAEEEGIEPTRENLHEISQRYMAENGDSYFMHRVADRIESNGWKAVGVSGIRTPDDVRVARERFGDDLLLVHVRVDDPRVRYERLLARDQPRDRESFDDFYEQEREEEEQFQGGEALDEADVAINNSRSLEAFHEAIDYLLIEGLIDEEVDCKI